MFKQIMAALALLLVSHTSIHCTAPDEKYVDRINKATAKRLWKEKRLQLCATGGAMMFDIRKLRLGFDYNQEIDLPTARALLIHAVETYRSAINSDKNVRPFLTEYPFPVQNIEISLFINKPDGGFNTEGNLGVAAANQGTFEYFVFKGRCMGPSLTLIQEESYDKACRLNAGHLNAKEQCLERIRRETAEELQQEQGIQLYNEGSMVEDNVDKLYLGLRFYQEVELHKARELLLYAADKYRSKINNDPALQPLLCHHPLSKNNLRVHLYFHQPDGSIPQGDNIQLVALSEGTLEYNIYVDNGKRILFKTTHEESYKEACHLVEQQQKKRDKAPTP